MPELEDNVYPRSAEYFMREPVTQVIERNTEKDQVLSNAPQIRGAVANLKKRAAFYESVNAVSDEVLTNPEEFMHVIAANKLTAAALRTEINTLIDYLKEYTED